MSDHDSHHTSSKRLGRLPLLGCLFAVTIITACSHAHPERVEHDPSMYRELAPGMYSVRQSQGFKAPLPYEPWAQITHIPLAEDGASERRGTASLAARSPHLRTHTFALLTLFKVFQATISQFDMSNCQLSPTCSRFGLQATSRYGFRGVVLTFARLMRDHNADHYQRDPENEDDKLDPLENYIFFWRPAKLDNHAEHEDSANAWDEYVRATDPE